MSPLFQLCGHASFIQTQGFLFTNRNTAVGQDFFAIEVGIAQHDIGFVLHLQIQEGDNLFGHVDGGAGHGGFFRQLVVRHSQHFQHIDRSGISGFRGENIDIGDTNRTAPVTDDQTGIPAVMSTMGLELIAVSIFNSVDAEVFLFQTASAALRVQTVDRIRAPLNQPDRSVGRASTVPKSIVILFFCWKNGSIFL